MKIKAALFFFICLSAFLLWKMRQIFDCRQIGGKSVCVIDTIYTKTLDINNKVNFKFVGSDGIPYYFSLSDTVPTLPFSIPHLLLSQGDPLYLHSVLALDNNTRTGDDSMNAIIGLVDNSGTTNNVLKATPNQIGIQTTLAGDTSGGAYYGFTKNGLDLRRGEGNVFERTFFLSNHRGSPKQVLTLNATGDTAQWATNNAGTTVTEAQQYFSPVSGKTISIMKFAYNIVSPASGLSTLTLSLPDSPEDGDWFEITFTEPVNTILYTKGKVAKNAIKSASVNNYYKKYVYRQKDMTWY